MKTVEWGCAPVEFPWSTAHLAIQATPQATRLWKACGVFCSPFAETPLCVEFYVPASTRTFMTSGRKARSHQYFLAFITILWY